MQFEKSSSHEKKETGLFYQLGPWLFKRTGSWWLNSWWWYWRDWEVGSVVRKTAILKLGGQIKHNMLYKALYEVLDVPMTASQGHIKKRWHRVSRKPS